MPYKYVIDFDDTDYSYSTHPSITLLIVGEDHVNWWGCTDNLEEAFVEIEKFYKEAIEDYTERLEELRKEGERLRELKEEAEQEVHLENFITKLPSEETWVSEFSIGTLVVG